MNKILLIPGSFNPITNAHVDMELTDKKAYNADAILTLYICCEEKDFDTWILSSIAD